MRSLIITTLSLLLAAAAFAQTPSTRVLLPVVATNLSGAFGSQWTTDIVAFNNSPHRTAISSSLSCPATCTGGLGLDVGQVVDITNAVPRPGIPALFMYVYLADPAQDNVQFGLRVRDLSQQANSWGTEVPVVRDADAFARPFDLLNVPLVARFRQTLRVYDLAATSSSSVKVQYFAMPAGTLLKEYDLPIMFPTDQLTPPTTPGYAEVGFVGNAPELAGVERIRVRIIPMNEQQRLWGMVSVTNNDTQELTIISPQ
jgi:hypothetical protein